MRERCLLYIQYSLHWCLGIVCCYDICSHNGDHERPGLGVSFTRAKYVNIMADDTLTLGAPFTKMGILGFNIILIH